MTTNAGACCRDERHAAYACTTVLSDETALTATAIASPADIAPAARPGRKPTSATRVTSRVPNSHP
jgi:hypothetical protein